MATRALQPQSLTQSATLSPVVSLLRARCRLRGVFRVVVGAGQDDAEAAPVGLVVATAVGVRQACTRQAGAYGPRAGWRATLHTPHHAHDQNLSWQVCTQVRGFEGLGCVF